MSLEVNVLSPNERVSSSSSYAIQVLHNVNRVIHDEPLNSVLQVRQKHRLAVLDLLRLSIIVVLNLKLVHVIPADSRTLIQVLHE